MESLHLLPSRQISASQYQQLFNAISHNSSLTDFQSCHTIDGAIIASCLIQRWKDGASLNSLDLVDGCSLMDSFQELMMAEESSSYAASSLDFTSDKFALAKLTVHKIDSLPSSLQYFLATTRLKHLSFPLLLNLPCNQPLSLQYLNSLDLSQCQIHERGMIQLARSLIDSQVTKLKIDGRYGGCAGMYMLGRAVGDGCLIEVEIFGSKEVDRCGCDVTCDCTLDGDESYSKSCGSC